MKKIISTTNAPAAIGTYSQAIDCGNFLVTSGQVPFDPATGCGRRAVGYGYGRRRFSWAFLPSGS